MLMAKDPFFHIFAFVLCVLDDNCLKQLLLNSKKKINIYICFCRVNANSSYVKFLEQLQKLLQQMLLFRQLGLLIRLLQRKRGRFKFKLSIFICNGCYLL